MHSLSSTRAAIRSNRGNRHVYLVDDSREELLFVQRVCSSAGIDVTTFDSGEAFLDYVSQHNVNDGCVLIDMLMPQMSGLELFAEIRRRDLPLICVLITSFADTASCCAAFRAGIFDFIEKNGDADELVQIVQRALDESHKSSSDEQSLPAAWQTLTERELEVANCLTSGFALKKIAAVLGITAQTASKHRSRIFSKLGVNNEVDLLKSRLGSR